MNRRVEIVAEAGRWSVFIPGLPVSADGARLQEAINEMIDALQAYAEDWKRRLLDAPNHRDNRDLVQFVGSRSDAELREWVAGHGS